MTDSKCKELDQIDRAGAAFDECLVRLREQRLRLIRSRSNGSGRRKLKTKDLPPFPTLRALSDAQG